MTGRVKNFAAGPACLPMSVLEQAQAALFNYNGSGVGVMEMSHRGADFKAIIQQAESRLREILKIPETHSVLFMQGGGTSQFSAVPLNLFGKGKDGQKPTADYIVTGSWSEKAAKEAEKWGDVRHVIPSESFDKNAEGKPVYTTIPETDKWQLNPEASYVYYCDNETVNGVEFPFVPETGSVPLVADMSSNILSRDVDVSKFAVIYAGDTSEVIFEQYTQAVCVMCAQKNIGCAGVTIVIVRKDLISTDLRLPSCPTMLSYEAMDKAGSMHNTPPTWPIFIANLVFGWVASEGGLVKFDQLAAKKSSLVYTAIDNSDGYYSAVVAKTARSRMNVPFLIKSGNADLEAKFVKEATAAGLTQLKGHRSVGGLRASLYNAVTVADTEALVAFMDAFRTSNP